MDTATTATATNTIPAFGTHLPAHGGHFAAIVRGATVDGVQQPPDALIFTTAEFEATTTWGEYRQDVPGCASRTDGHANTLAMLAANCPAAMHARGITVDGHSDYYLPSLGELNTAAANAPELFDPNGYYWSSTQDGRISAFYQSFEDGISYWNLKDSELRVRACRRIPLHTLTT
jgi:hypothetical protein